MRVFPTETQQQPSQLVMSADSVGKRPLHSLASGALFVSDVIIEDGLKNHACVLSGLPQCGKAELSLKEKLCTLHGFIESHVPAKLQCYLVITHI